MLLKGFLRNAFPLVCCVLKRQFCITSKYNYKATWNLFEIHHIQRHVFRPLLLPSDRNFIFKSSFSKKHNFSKKRNFSKKHNKMSDNKFIVGYAKMGTSSCKKCKVKIEKGALRIGKLVSNPFSSDGDMKQWHHPDCIFDSFKRARAATKKIEEPDDMEGFGDLRQEDKDKLNDLIKDFWSSSNLKKTPTKASPKPKAGTVQSNIPYSPSRTTNSKSCASDEKKDDAAGSTTDDTEKDNAFREFRRLCADIAEENSYTGKTAIVSKFLHKGSRGGGFKGDTYLWLKLLLPGVVKTVYNLNSKQIVKLFSNIFGTDLQEMVADLDQGDVAETVKIFFEQSNRLEPQKKSTLSIQQVDQFLDELSMYTKEEDQQRVLTKIAKRCTYNDLKMVIRLIKHDLRINAGAKHILDSLDPNAYAAFQASRNLQDVVDRVMENKNGDGKIGMSKKLSVRASLMTPVLPMLAEACRSVNQAMKKCPNGFFAEIKYDGERVQLHKKGDTFQYFSRSLKPVLPHKVQHFKEFIPKAFPSGDDLILDAEVLLIDTNTGNPLPFGSLGVHKKSQFQDAKVCLFVFDCLHINGENIMDKPIKTRRKILRHNMTEVEHRVLFSEMQHITDAEDLQELMNKVFRQGLEGLVLKDVNSLYEPGKRHWLKIKKDYLEQGTMADSADLVVLGAYFGTGNKGGIMSIFLLGVYDPNNDQWCTVTKCHSGLDDKTLEQLQTQMDMIKISKDANKVPSWLNIKSKQIVPDFVIKDPQKAPVWEIQGAEFSKAEIHTADGISIRFPRIAKFRDDKSWKEATDLPRLRELFKKSKEISDLFPSKKGDKGPFKKKKSSQGSENDSSDEGPSNRNGHASDAGNSAPSTPSKVTSSPSKVVGPMDLWAKAGVKRSSVKDEPDSDECASPSKKLKSKPVCKYGADCYQTNPAHIENFDHPVNKKLPAPGKKLPNVFTGAKIYLPENIKQYRQLKRFVIGFDGDLVSDFQKKTATHVVIDKGDVATPTTGICISVDWLWTCIKKKKLMPTHPYIIK